MDRGLWISWYDLPREKKTEYFDWLNNSYIPKVQALPGCLWAAHYASEEKVRHPGEEGRLSETDDLRLPTGDRYILMFGGMDAHVFTNVATRNLESDLSDGDRKMLSVRIGERKNLMTEEARLDGPAVDQRGPGITPSNCIQLGNFNSGAYQDEEELAAWYSQWRMPSMRKLSGSVGVRKLVSVAGWSKHAILYEWISVKARNEQFINHEDGNPQMAEWTDRVVRKLVHAPGSPNLARRIWPPTI